MIAEEAFEWLDAPIVRLAGPDIPSVPFNEAYERYFLPDVPRIAATMRKLARY
jgi:pyruvate/2-oxoglutarate/acetoin dehydrogenase E1 component